MLRAKLQTAACDTTTRKEFVGLKRSVHACSRFFPSRLVLLHERLREVKQLRDLRGEMYGRLPASVPMAVKQTSPTVCRGT